MEQPDCPNAAELNKNFGPEAAAGGAAGGSIAGQTTTHQATMNIQSVESHDDIEGVLEVKAVRFPITLIMFARAIL